MLRDGGSSEYGGGVGDEFRVFRGGVWKFGVSLGVLGFSFRFYG